MNRKGRPENLELGSMQQPIHLVSSEPALVGMGAATTPTIKLSAAYEFPTTGSNGGKSPVMLSAVKQSQDTKLAISTNTNQQGRENSDLSPSEQNGNAGNYRPRDIIWTAKETCHFCQRPHIKMYNIEINNFCTQVCCNTPY